jgi:hypothetical protein
MNGNEIEQRLKALNERAEDFYPDMLKELSDKLGENPESIQSKIDYIIKTRSYSPDKYFLLEILLTFHNIK